MGDPRLIYVPREDATPEGERAALAAVYRFVLNRHEESKNLGAEEPSRAKSRRRSRKEAR